MPSDRRIRTLENFEPIPYEDAVERQRERVRVANADYAVLAAENARLRAALKQAIEERTNERDMLEAEIRRLKARVAFDEVDR